MCTMYCPVHRGMTKQQFEAIFEGLTPRRREVLLKFLANESDEAIANSLHITKATVRKHIEEICKAFGLSNDFSDERRSKRQDLVALFAKYKPELLGGCASVVENEGAIANPNSPVSREDELDLDALVEKVRSHPHHRDKIQDQCGRLRILDVEWLVGIDNIYIDVNVLEKLPSNRRLELSDFQRFNAAREHFDRLGLGRVREPQVPGLEAVTRYSKLMVLGKPGAGKTTFLKSLAVQCIQGDFQKERIPIFIALKVFAEDAKLKAELGLLNYINQKLCVCDVSEQQVEKLLHQGRFLILLDGLDEVKADVGDKVLTEVSNFSRKYFRNQFVITCRIAAQLANQRGSLEFTDVEVADFDEEQIEAFAKKWFVAVAKNSREEGLTKASQFIKKLQLPENQQIRELAVTPILLNLMCLAFQEKTAFPSKRAKLYEQGLDILLDRWDKSRGVKRDEAYRNLSLEDKKELLSQVAFITFERGDYFFEQYQIEQHIADYLRILPDTQTKPKALKRDSKAVLKSLEAQHGLLIERAREIYSFSHLTFQEYFTAKAIVDSAEPQALQNMFSHISENRWREVFLLVGSIRPNANKLLLSMKQYIETRITSDKLQHFLKWIYKKSLPIQDSLKSAAIRAFYLDFYRPWIQRQETDLAEEIDTNFQYALSSIFLEKRYSFLLKNKRLDVEKIYNSACRLRLDKTLLSIFECAHKFERTLSGILWFYKFEDNEVSGYYFCEENFDINQLWDLDFFLNDAIEDANKLDKQLEAELKKLCFQLYETRPLEKDPLDTLENWAKYREWWRTNSKFWIDKLNDLAMEYRDLPLNRKFSKEELELLAQYRYAHKLLVECLNSGCNVSPEVQKEIEETLLLPKDEIEQRKAKGNSTSGI